jgi:hypothetical protein
MTDIQTAIGRWKIPRILLYCMLHLCLWTVVVKFVCQFNQKHNAAALNNSLSNIPSPTNIQSLQLN